MARVRVPIRRFSGLNTKGLEDGRAAVEFVLLQNMRLNQGAIIRRNGKVYLDGVTSFPDVIDLDGAALYFSSAIDTRVWKLGTKFTIRGICNPDSKTGVNPIFRAGETTPSVELTTAGSKLVASVWDSGATKTSVTSTDDMPTTSFSYFFTRSGAALSLSIDNGTADTATMSSATNVLRTPAGDFHVGYDGTDFFPGTLDSLEVFNIVLPSNNDRMLRWADPRMEACLCAIDMGSYANKVILDRSRFRNHLYHSGTPAEVTALAHPYAQVHALMPFRTRSGERRIFVQAGEAFYIAELS